MSKWGCWEACLLRLIQSLLLPLCCSARPVGIARFQLSCPLSSYVPLYTVIMSPCRGNLISILPVFMESPHFWWFRTCVLHPDQRLSPPPGSQPTVQQLRIKDITLRVRHQRDVMSFPDTKLVLCKPGFFFSSITTSTWMTRVQCFRILKPAPFNVMPHLF